MWELDLGANGNWAYGILVIHINEKDQNLRNIIETKLCIFFFIFFLLKRKHLITIHMSEEGFDWKGVNYFIQKDE